MQSVVPAISEWIVGGTLGGCLIAAMAVIVDRYGQRPAWAHRLWVLVMIKLMLPSMFFASASMKTQLAFWWLPQTRFGQTVSPDLPHRVDTASAWVIVLAAAWLLGSVAMLVRVGWCASRVRRLIEYRGRFDLEATQVLRRCAGNLSSVDRLPDVWLVDAFVSPMLYCDWFRGRSLGPRFSSRPIIVFPRGLWGQLSEPGRQSLLRHELAHWSRGDHHVRRIEVAAMIFVWWHPLVWIARQQIESHEERCCDQAATLDRPNQRRVYAESILRTLDFLCEPLERDRSELRARPLASGLSGLPIVRDRLQKIMRPSNSESPCVNDSEQDHNSASIRFGALVVRYGRFRSILSAGTLRSTLSSLACALALVITFLPVAPSVTVRLVQPTKNRVLADRPLSVISNLETETPLKNLRHP
jgi:beta-lactamase regulating signal transducer with metallopeptidase domain